MDKNYIFQKFVAFTAAVHQVTNEITKGVKSEAITPVQYKILEYIAVSQPVTISEISECMLMSMPNTSRELKKLSEKQLCEKITDNEDRRKQFIRLSNKGEDMMNEVFGHVKSRFDERIKDISEKELKEIEQALDLLHRKVFY
ncbi:DNA-binding MarR family transcriptional regulator [Paenibacillus anaericanus]|uniref:MarR family winged helix-turn-helix transcriptional regulator n=1 Tax=Paenibacillus anaericanus TaxID=170367 RepID=UPI00278B5806|nr:MarR family winged helix-turn-helix transcriptional regulator [Paenibacillus anaericanus]MDQ0090991.1 DNA-binding MarR family transcriptional regulator [Paenibacillus anaericanus]